MKKDLWYLNRICSSRDDSKGQYKSSEGFVMSWKTEIFLFPIRDATVCIQLKDNLNDSLWV